MAICSVRYMLSASLNVFVVFVVVRSLVRVEPIHTDLSGHLGLAGTAPGPLARHHRPVQKEFSAPHAPWLAALERA